jgi:hypothetical protein
MVMVSGKRRWDLMGGPDTGRAEVDLMGGEDDLAWETDVMRGPGDAEAPVVHPHIRAAA